MILTMTFLMQNGFTPLYIACTFGQAKIVEMLIQNGALIDLPTKVVIIQLLWFVIKFLPMSTGWIHTFVCCMPEWSCSYCGTIDKEWS